MNAVTSRDGVEARLKVTVSKNSQRGRVTMKMRLGTERLPTLRVSVSVVILISRKFLELVCCPVGESVGD